MVQAVDAFFRDRDDEPGISGIPSRPYVQTFDVRRSTLDVRRST